MNESTDHHGAIVDDPALPGAAFARQSLLIASMVSTALLVFWILASFVGADGLAGLDISTMLWLRTDGAPTDPIGATWFEGAMRDITALGSNVVLFVLVALATTILALSGRHGPALLLGWSAIASFFVNGLLKLVAGRIRPDFLATSVVTETSSFPSSHAMHASVVYLLLAAIAMREIADRRLQTLVVASAGTLVLLIGLSRIYLGAHWTSDVLAGWTIGSALALAAWLLARRPRPPS